MSDSNSRTMDTVQPVADSCPPSPGVPWQIWITVFFLSLEGVGNLLSIPANPAAATWFAAKVLFIAGLILGWRLVFVWFVVVGALHVLAFRVQAPFVAFLNLVIVLLVISARRHFFSGHDRKSLADGAKTKTSRMHDPDFDA